MYADENYFLNEFKGDISEGADLSRLLKSAEAKVDELTFNRIRAIGFENLSEFQKRCIIDAVCHIAEYYDKNGEDESSVQSYTILGVSVTSAQLSTEASRLHISPVAASLLKQSGLMARGL